MEPDEILVGVKIPVSAAGTTFLIDELSRRQGDFAMAGIAASTEKHNNRWMGIVGFGCSDRPVRLRALENLMSANDAMDVSIDDLKTAIRSDLQHHLHGKDSAFKQTLMQALVLRNLPASRRQAA